MKKKHFFIYFSEFHEESGHFFVRTLGHHTLPSWIRMYSVFKLNFQICITLILCSKQIVSGTVLGEITKVTL